MAGHSSGWIKRPGGAAKGRVFVSREVMRSIGMEPGALAYAVRTGGISDARLLELSAQSVQPGGQARRKPRVAPTWDELREREVRNRANLSTRVAIPAEGSTPHEYERAIGDAAYNAEEVFNSLPERIRNRRPDLAARVEQAIEAYENHETGEPRPYVPRTPQPTPEAESRRTLEMINQLIDELNQIRRDPAAEDRRLSIEERRQAVQRGQGQLPGLEEFNAPRVPRAPRAPRAPQARTAGTRQLREKLSLSLSNGRTVSVDATIFDGGTVRYATHPRLNFSGDPVKGLGYSLIDPATGFIISNYRSASEANFVARYLADRRVKIPEADELGVVKDGAALERLGRMMEEAQQAFAAQKQQGRKK